MNHLHIEVNIITGKGTKKQKAYLPVSNLIILDVDPTVDDSYLSNTYICYSHDVSKGWYVSEAYKEVQDKLYVKL